MNAENLIFKIKNLIDNEGKKLECFITPTKGDPNIKQNETSIIVMENNNKGRKPKFIINVNEII